MKHCTSKEKSGNEERIQVILYAVVLLCVVILLSGLIFLNNYITKCNVDDFRVGNIDEIELAVGVQEERDSSLIVEGWFQNENDNYTLFNYGMNSYMSGYYNHFHLATVKDGIVYEFPTKISVREQGESCHFVCEIDEAFIQIIAEYGLCITVEDPYAVKSIYYTDIRVL